MSIKDISKLILESKKIGITYHVSPDGDAVGSALALLNALRYMGKNAYIISKDTIGANLKYLKLSEEITGEVSTPTDDTDLVMVLDCGNYERISADLDNFKNVIVNMDHHISNDKYGNVNYVDAKAAATAEIVYELLSELNINLKDGSEETLDIGTCIYTSLVTDTGGFRHSNVTARTHKIASVLKEIGVENSTIYQNLFDNKDFSKIKLIGEVLRNMELVLEGKVTIIKITKEMVDKLGVSMDDTSDLISYGLQIKGAEVAFLIKETDTGCKASLRSKSVVDVRSIAETFGGGGHVRAAGITLKGYTIEEGYEAVINEIEKVI